MHVNWFWVLLLMGLVIAGVTLGGMACPTAFSPFAHKWDDVFNGSFTSGAIDLSLTTGNGSITCRTWSGPGYKLIVHTRALGISEGQARALAAELISVEHGDGSIKVNDGGGWFPKAMTSIELYLPAGPEYHLQANAGNGAVKLEGGSYATARVHTGNGALEGTAVIGELEASAGNGSIRMAAAGSGRWTLSTKNGLINVDTADLGETALMVDADTTNGKIMLDIGGQSLEQKGSPGHTPLRMSTRGYEQAHRQLFIQTRTNLGKITVHPGP